VRKKLPAPAMVDTNIVVYAYDPTEPNKHKIARRLLEDLSASGSLA
jgi:predicted nucleic acid-binding protein